MHNALYKRANAQIKEVCIVLQKEVRVHKWARDA